MLFHTLFAQWIEHVLFFCLLLKTLIKKIIKETVTIAGQINNLKVHFFLLAQQVQSSGGPGTPTQGMQRN